MEAVKNYEVKLEIFEGPLDLLVYLAQKNELRPEDIPISIITDQYLEYIEQIGVHNLSQAGEFLVMASRLMWLKAREMLPKDQLDEIDEMEFDLDKEALLQQMREHQTFKEASNYLRHLEVRNFGSFSRGKREKLPSEEKDSSQEEDDLFEAGIFELLSAFSSAMKHRKNTVVHQVEIDDVTIERQIKKFQNMLNEKKYFHFEEFFEDDARKIVIVVSFMALLEICKISTAYIQQHALFGPIWVYSRKHHETAAKMPADPPDMHFSTEVLNPGLVNYIQESILKRNEEQALEKILGELDYLKEAGVEDDDEDDEHDDAGRSVEGADNKLEAAAQEIMS